MNQEHPDPPKKKKPRSSRPASKTSSTKPEAAPTEAELLAKIASHTAETLALYDDLFKMLDGDPNQIPPDVRPGRYDLVLLYDVRLVGRDGILTRLKGRTDFPESLHPHAMATTMRNFQRVFTTMVGEPLAVKLNRVLSDLGLSLTENDAPHSLPAAPAVDGDSRVNGHLLDDQD